MLYHQQSDIMAPCYCVANFVYFNIMMSFFTQIHPLFCTASRPSPCNFLQSPSLHSTALCCTALPSSALQALLARERARAEFQDWEQKEDEVRGRSGGEEGGGRS